MPRSPWSSGKDAKTSRYSKAEEASALARAQLPPGILNSANDCFANSVLQSLIATPMLEDMVRFRKHVGEHAPGDPTLSPALTNGRQTAGIHEIEWTQGLTVSDTFLQFMEHAYRARGDSSARPLNPRGIIRALGAKFDQYLDFRQQDAHELLRHLLDAMYMEEVDVVKLRQPPLDPKAHLWKVRRQAERTFSGRSAAATRADVSVPVLEEPTLEPFSSTVFGGRLASIIVCNTCKHISQTCEDFMDLSLPIKADDLKKKSTFRAFAERFTTSLVSQAPSAAPSRPTTPNPVTPDSIVRVDSPQPWSNAPLAGDRDSDYISHLGRSVSTRLNKSRERLDQFRAGTRPGSRPASVDAHIRASKQKKRSTKPTPGEAAYLRALLRDEPSHINPLTMLRGGGAPPLSSGSSSNNHMWGRIGSTTTSLLDCLRMFTSVEVLDGDNSFACHNCWKISNSGTKRRQTRDKSPGSSSSSSASSNDDDDQVANEAISKPSGLLRPDSTVSRSVSADALLAPASTPGPSFLQRPAPLSSISSPLFTSVPGKKQPAGDTGGNAINLANISSTNATGTASNPAPVPFPTVDVPSISTSPSSPVLTVASPITHPDPDSISPVPRFRRFSSFHAETFLSPNVSRESLASAPPESVHAILSRQLLSPEGALASDTEGSTNGGEADVQSTAPESAMTSQTDLSLGINGNPDNPDKDRESSRRSGVLAPLTSLATDISHKGFANSALPLATVDNKPSHVKRVDQVIHRNAFKRYLIDVPPPVLVIHLKRFQQSIRSGGTPLAGGAKKLEDSVSFPEFLDLRPFLAPRKEKYGLNERGRTPRQHVDLRRGSGAKQGRYHHHHWTRGDGGEDEEPPVMYRLYAVVVHIGSMLGGHYIAYTALPDPTAAPDNTTKSQDAQSTNAPSTPGPPTDSVRSTSLLVNASASGAGAFDRGHHDPDHHRSKLPASRQWCYVSDATVRLASLEEALKQKAYLLFYERMS